jgi:hypothetical protein
MGSSDASYGAFSDPTKHQISIDQYVTNLRSILDILERAEPQAKLILCLTTPVPAPRTTKPDGSTHRLSTDVPRYNEAAAACAASAGVDVHDLYSFAMPRLSEIQLPADVHYTTDGSSVLGRQVASVLLRALQHKPGSKL